MIKYFEVSDILKIHNKVLKLSGGLKGYKDKSGIEKVCLKFKKVGGKQNG